MSDKSARSLTFCKFAATSCSQISSGLNKVHIWTAWGKDFSIGNLYFRCFKKLCSKVRLRQEQRKENCQHFCFFLKVIFSNIWATFLKSKLQWNFINTGSSSYYDNIVHGQVLNWRWSKNLIKFCYFHHILKTPAIFSRAPDNS